MNSFNSNVAKNNNNILSLLTVSKRKSSAAASVLDFVRTIRDDDDDAATNPVQSAADLERELVNRRTMRRQVDSRHADVVAPQAGNGVESGVAKSSANTTDNNDDDGDDDDDEMAPDFLFDSMSAPLTSWDLSKTKRNAMGGAVGSVACLFFGADVRLLAVPRHFCAICFALTQSFVRIWSRSLARACVFVRACFADNGRCQDSGATQAEARAIGVGVVLDSGVFSFNAPSVTMHVVFFLFMCSFVCAYICRLRKKQRAAT